jgi:hypothetical protein
MFFILQEQINSLYLGVFQVDNSRNKDKDKKDEYTDEFYLHSIEHIGCYYIKYRENCSLANLHFGQI